MFYKAFMPRHNKSQVCLFVKLFSHYYRRTISVFLGWIAFVRLYAVWSRWLGRDTGWIFKCIYRVVTSWLFRYIGVHIGFKTRWLKGIYWLSSAEKQRFISLVAQILIKKLVCTSMSFNSVGFQVYFKITAPCEGFMTDLTFKRFLPCMGTFMVNEVVFLSKSFMADFTFKWFLPCMGL